MKRAGTRRHKVTIQQATESADSYGGTVQTWADYCIRWASIEPMTGREFFNAKQINSELTSKITVPYDTTTADISSKMRVVYGSRTFRIDSPPINPGEMNREIQLMCSELN